MKQRWPIDEDLRRRLVRRADEELNHADPEIALRAGALLAMLEKQNQDDKLKRRVNRVNIQNLLQMREPDAPDPEYLEWKRQRLISAKPDAAPSATLTGAVAAPAVMATCAAPAPSEAAPDPSAPPTCAAPAPSAPDTRAVDQRPAGPLSGHVRARLTGP